ncbi:MAG: YbgC/FadM family acyl-CoA thioesterase [Sphingomonadaceae bacterium]
MTASPDPSSGSFADGVHRCAFRVYFEDTDAGGIVYHANYLRWYERARTEMLRLLGVALGQALDDATGTYVVAHLDMKFAGPARLDDVVTVESRVADVQKASVRLHQVAKVQDRVINEAQIRLGFVGPDGRPRRQPEDWLAAFASLAPREEG